MFSVQCLCPITCLVPFPLSIQWRIAASGVKSSSEGPLILTCNRLFRRVGTITYFYIELIKSI